MARNEMGPAIAIAMALFLSACEEGTPQSVNETPPTKLALDLHAMNGRIRASVRRQAAIELNLREVEKRIAALVVMHLSLESTIRRHGREIRIGSRHPERNATEVRRLREENRQLLERLASFRSRMRRRLEKVDELLAKCRIGVEHSACRCAGFWIEDGPSHQQESKRREVEERIESLGKVVQRVERMSLESRVILEAKLSLLSTEIRRLRRMRHRSTDDVK